MKLISLNTWGGKVYQPLITFIKQQSTDTDIFCFQEVFNTTANLKEVSGFRMNLFDEISKVLENYQGYFAPTVDNYIAGSFQPNFIDFNLSWGLAIFVKKNLSIKSHKDFWVYGNRGSFNPKDLNSLSRNVQYINIISEGKKFTICNIHGIWVKGGKKDTPSRIQQSKQILSFLDQQDGKKILCGDFNLDIDTKSVKMLESTLTNLIKEYHIKNTRSKFFPAKEKFADYTFVSNEIRVKSFEVPEVEISDHLPMILQFS